MADADSTRLQHQALVGEIKTAFGAAGFELSHDGPTVTGVRFLGSASVPEDKVFTAREVLQRIDELRGGK